MTDAAGLRHLPGYLNAREQTLVLQRVRAVISDAPPFVPRMPRTGRPFSVRMTNCGPLGWVSDQAGGYRYQATHPETGRPWPAMPPMLIDLWRALTAYPAQPEACLINFYAAGARMGAHRDADEEDKAAPVVSISLGDDAIFHVGGARRNDPKQRIRLRSGDVVVLGGAARMAYHGIDRILPATSRLLAESGRINLTLRRVNKA
ncbi:MAG: alpha-ketoglutarate-dependent dioxygenase AlkB [Hyphomicrobiaceae bacterium]|nr:MAG: alpha-ketoglutarate-dependent dioxygenase AlkB [Hyphomicrobiaceae bacterium]